MTRENLAQTGEEAPRGVRTVRLLATVAAVVAALSAGAAPQELVRYPAINAGLGAPPPDAVRRSPAAAWSSFLSLASADKFEQAANLLDLSAVPPGQQQKAGSDAAEKLYRVLAILKAREDAVTTADEAGPTLNGQPTNAVVALRFDRAGISGEVQLRHVMGATPYELAWLVSRETVARVPFWHRVLVKGEAARGAEPLDVGLGPIPREVERGTPREAVAGYLAACQEGRFDLAAYYLDLGAIPADRQQEEGTRLARRLAFVLQRTGWVDLNKLSNEPLGTPETGVPENLQLFGVVEVKHQPVELLLAHRSDAELGHVWTVSQETVAEIDRLYAAHGYGWLGDHAPPVLFTLSVADVQLWQWLSILLGLAAAGLVSRYLGWLLVRLLLRMARRTLAAWDGAVTWALDGPTAFVLSAALLLAIASWLGVTPDAWKIARYIAKLLALSGVGWFLVRLVDGVAARLRETAKQGSQVGLGFLPMTVRFAKVVFVLLVVLAALDVVGINVIAALGALGIGAVALAFAAQKTLENLFGTAAIASDRPFQIGDFVTIGQDSGTVEDIGFRSTRLRTLAKTLVTIPNGLIASGRVENFSVRDRIMYNPVLSLSYETTRGQLTYVIEETKRLLREHPKVSQDSTRVRFAAFGEWALRIEVWCWIATGDFMEYTGVVEELNFAIAEIVQRSGTRFAFPTRTLYMTGGGSGGTEPGSPRVRGAGDLRGPRGEPPDSGGQGR